MRDAPSEEGPRATRVLALDTDWLSIHGGMTTFNRQLCTALAAAGARVFCVVLSASPDQILHAARAGVTLILAPMTPGGSGRDALMRPVELPDGIAPDIVIGHGRITGPAARALVEDQYTSAARLHVVHTSPDETEWAKTDEDHPIGERAEDRVRVEKEIAQGATGIAAVGPRLHEQLIRDLSATADPPVALRLDPGFDVKDRGDRSPPPGGPKQILILGRLEDQRLKGLDIAAKAVAHAIGHRADSETEVEILLRGTPQGKQAELHIAFVTWTGKASLRIAMRSYSEVETDLQEDIRRATLVLMPSRAEGFGLAGAEAIVAGTPVLVSRRSGLGALLRQVLPADDAARIVIPVHDDDTDVRNWGDAIASVLDNADAAFARASRVRRVLAERCTWSSAAAKVLSLRAPGAGVAPLTHARKHWLASVRVFLPGGRAECLFTGRRRAIEHIVRWISARHDRPVCVVTGDPGSGKSAILAWFALGGDDTEVGESLYDESAYPRHPGPLIKAVVHAKALRLQAVVEAIAEQLGLVCADADQLHAELAELSTPTCIVLDAVDESPDAPELIKQIVQPIIRRRATTSVRLLVGARRHLAQRLSKGVESVDLDRTDEDGFADPDALAEYAFRILVSAAPVDGSGLFTSQERTRRVANALGRRAGCSFLIARLSSLTVAERGEILPDRSFPDSVEAAMDGYLDALPIDRAQAEDLLRPLAHAHGLGLPSALWLRLAGELAGAPGRYTVSDLVDLFAGPLGSLITATRQAGMDGQPLGRPLYRLFHEALDDTLSSVPAAFPDAPRPGPEVRETISTALVASVRSEAGTPVWAEADPYVLAYVLSHAAGTSVLPRLTRDAMFLVRAGRTTVVRALPNITAADMPAASAYESVARHQDTETPVPERAAYLALGALRSGDAGLIQAWQPQARLPGAPWWPLKARWRPIVGHQIARKHRLSINQVGVATVFEEVVVLSGSDDRTLAITNLPEAWSEDRGSTTRIADTDQAISFEHAVRALAVAEVDGLPLVVVGTAGGQLHVLELPGGAALTRPSQAAGAAVSALATVQHASEWIAVAGYADGHLRPWHVLPLQPLAPATSIDGTGVDRIVPGLRGDVLLVTGSGFLWHWEIGTGRLLRRSAADEPRVTALAAIPGDDPALWAVTGHDDGSVRLWPAGPVPAVTTVQVPGSPLISTISAARVGAKLLVLLAGETDDVQIIDVASRALWPIALSGHGEPLWDLTTADIAGRPMAVGGGEDDGVHLWPLSGIDAIQPQDRFVAERWSTSRLAAAGPRILATVSNDQGRFAVFDALAGDRVAGPFGPPEPELLSTTALALIEGQVWYAAGTENGTLGIGIAPGPPTWSSGAEPDWIVYSGFLVLDGRPILVSVTSGGIVSIRDEVATRPHARRDQLLTGLEQAVTAVSIAPDPDGGAVLLAGDRSGRAGAWRLSDLSPVAPVRSIASEAVRSLMSSPAIGGVVAGTHSGLLLLETRHGLLTHSAHRRSVTCTLETEDLLISGGEDGLINVWRSARMGNPPVSIDVGAPISDLLSLPDGTLAAGTSHGTVVIDPHTRDSDGFPSFPQ
ncbi:glycosyltransferase [Nonomuraea sp. NPDC048892]|uniref:glycosyltransferase n=1 Tax=Nonomuraea sp. NPDC048892 TaxID=3154624 RepID=UPI0033ECDCAD